MVHHITPHKMGGSASQVGSLIQAHTGVSHASQVDPSVQALSSMSQEPGGDAGDSTGASSSWGTQPAIVAAAARAQQRKQLAARGEADPSQEDEAWEEHVFAGSEGPDDPWAGVEVKYRAEASQREVVEAEDAVFQSEKEFIDHLEAEAVCDGDHVQWLKLQIAEAKEDLALAIERDHAAAQKQIQFLEKRHAKMRYKEDVDRQRVAAASARSNNLAPRQEAGPVEYSAPPEGQGDVHDARIQWLQERVDDARADESRQSDRIRCLEKQISEARIDESRVDGRISWLRRMLVAARRGELRPDFGRSQMMDARIKQWRCEHSQCGRWVELKDVRLIRGGIVVCPRCYAYVDHIIVDKEAPPECYRYVDVVDVPESTAAEGQVDPPSQSRYAFESDGKSEARSRSRARTQFILSSGTDLTQVPPGAVMEVDDDHTRGGLLGPMNRSSLHNHSLRTHMCERMRRKAATFGRTGDPYPGEATGATFMHEASSSQEVPPREVDRSVGPIMEF